MSLTTRARAAHMHRRGLVLKILTPYRTLQLMLQTVFSNAANPFHERIM